MLNGVLHNCCSTCISPGTQFEPIIHIVICPAVFVVPVWLVIVGCRCGPVHLSLAFGSAAVAADVVVIQLAVYTIISHDFDREPAHWLQV